MASNLSVQAAGAKGLPPMDNFCHCEQPASGKALQ